VSSTLSGRIERITYENEQTGFRVIKLADVEGVSGTLSVVGRFQAVGEGLSVRVSGDFVDDPRHGRQFRADTLVPLEPDTLVGLERYLGSGVVPGVGPGFAKRIVQAFGLETLNVLDREPERLAEVPGLGERRREGIVKGWAAQRALSNVMLLLQTHGASASLAVRIVKQYGERAGEIVQRSPYRLALDVHGVGFKTADRIARSLGLAGDHPERAQAGVMHELSTLVESGHVSVPRSLLVERAARMLEVGEDHVKAALDALWASERVTVENDCVFPTRLYRAEVAVATGIARLLEGRVPRVENLDRVIAAYQARAKVELAPLQREAVELVAKHPVVIVTGGPGVGKTTIVRALLALLEAVRARVRLAAPTGRAAKRLGEATGRQATTLHRLLEFEPRTARFQRGASSPLEIDALIVDEASMIDLPLAAALIEAVPSSARLVIVGDADQLPSVGPGAFLRDLIDSGSVPAVRLAEIFRQAQESRIVENAHRILSGDAPVTSEPDDARADFFVISQRDAERAAEVIARLVVERIPSRFGLDAKRDVQVLTPMHRGPAGTQALNLLLQEKMNGTGPALESRGQRFRVGDKVLQTRNDYEREIFNGDLGVITSVDAEHLSLTVRFDEREVECEDAELDSLTLAYAISIHKSQGSEYPAVVVPLLASHFVMLSRNLLYTAVTRAKKLCVLVADPRALRVALSAERREERHTALRERLLESVVAARGE
jgi:exodeoxyribonuclease V alpha subunit